MRDISRVSCQKSPICHAEAWRVGPFWQDTLDMSSLEAHLDINTVIFVIQSKTTWIVYFVC